ncbi:hypothetical protein BZG36_04873 [Bifiguratus adelaidae]|uniref:Uncharacterized protein n=1 Tax=Bifiguratus adelaidae TaxID=1938954 RepID=A0A261XUI3_9FUNG|nr:hypothetical protein BZG36_04873 [Bifiguratus adelaidae]
MDYVQHPIAGEYSVYLLQTILPPSLAMTLLPTPTSQWTLGDAVGTPVVFELGQQYNCGARSLPFSKVSFGEAKLQIPYVRRRELKEGALDTTDAWVTYKKRIWMDNRLFATSTPVMYGLSTQYCSRVGFGMEALDGQHYADYIVRQGDEVPLLLFKRDVTPRFVRDTDASYWEMLGKHDWIGDRTSTFAAHVFDWQGRQVEKVSGVIHLRLEAVEDAARAFGDAGFKVNRSTRSEEETVEIPVDGILVQRLPHKMTRPQMTYW